jgi:Clathrin adaptor complex small chain
LAFCAVLVSRQYVDMNRIRVEGLLAAFPKLVGTGNQHTYVETENVRYVYQPLEGLYLLLITNKQSNILEDLETLRLLSKVVKEYVEEVTEPFVTEHAFELLFAFDEVISVGHKEEVTVAQVRQNTDMESNEEKLINMIKSEKIKQVNEVMQERSRQIERERVERSVRGGDPFRTSAQLPSGLDASRANLGIDDGPSFAPSVPTPSSYGAQPSAPSRAGPSKGMKLAKDKKNDLLSALEADTGGAVSTGGGLAVPSAPAPAAVPTDPVNVSIEEKLSVKMNKEGGLQHMEVQGTLVLLCTDEEAAFVQVRAARAAAHTPAAIDAATPQSCETCAICNCRVRVTHSTRASPCMSRKRKIMRSIGAGGAAHGREHGLPVQDAPQHRQGAVQPAGEARRARPRAALPRQRASRCPQVALPDDRRGAGARLCAAHVAAISALRRGKSMDITINLCCFTIEPWQLVHHELASHARMSRQLGQTPRNGG